MIEPSHARLQRAGAFLALALAMATGAAGALLLTLLANGWL